MKDYTLYVIITFLFLFFLLIYLYTHVTRKQLTIPDIKEDETNGLPEKFDPSLIPPDKLQVFQGNMLPVIPPTQLKLDSTNPSAPPVSANSQDTSMFLMAFNKCDPSCCPSPYSCDRGCVCMTKEQIDYVATRGSNSKSTRCTGVGDI